MGSIEKYTNSFSRNKLHRYCFLVCELNIKKYKYSHLVMLLYYCDVRNVEVFLLLLDSLFLIYQLSKNNKNESLINFTAIHQ